MPDFDPAAVLLKVVAVNSLYGTNVYAVDRAAQHICEVLDGVELASVVPQLGEDIAAIPPLPGGNVSRYRSFASKFAHFFIDHDRFPIHGSFAAKMLRAHLGRDAPAPDSGATYMTIEAAFRRLAHSAGLQLDSRRLVRYLWIVGRYCTLTTWAQVTMCRSSTMKPAPTGDVPREKRTRPTSAKVSIAIAWCPTRSVCRGRCGCGTGR